MSQVNHVQVRARPQNSEIFLEFDGLWQQWKQKARLCGASGCAVVIVFVVTNV